MSYYHQDSVFWIEVDKISANPYQPRREFDQEELQSLANSIRQYGVLQALVVTRKEVPKKDGGLAVEYELISGERRLRASKLAGIKEVPVLIREGGETDLMKLELAIIENIQREDLNVVERALAFEKLAKEFSFNKTQIAKKVGKSREYVSNSMRVLSLPEEILSALSAGKLSEGHARPLLMLVDRPDERQTLFKEILYKKISVREAERIAKKIAKDRVRKPIKTNPEIEALEKEFTDSLGTRVNIESREVGGKISIDYFSDEDLHSLLEILKMYKKKGNVPMLENFIAEAEKKEKGEVESKNISQEERDINSSEKPITEEKEETVEKIKEEISELNHTNVPEPENDQEKPELHFTKEEAVNETEVTNKEKTETSEENESGIIFEGENEEDPLDFLVEDEEGEEKSTTVEEDKTSEVEEQRIPEVEKQNKEDVVYEQKSSEADEQSKEEVAQETSKTEEGAEERDAERQEEVQETRRVENQESESSDSEEKTIKEKSEEAETVDVQKEEPVQEEPEDEEPKSIQEAVKRREQEEKMMREDFQYSDDTGEKDLETSESDRDVKDESDKMMTEEEKLKERLRQREAKSDKGDDDIYSVRNFTL